MASSDSEGPLVTTPLLGHDQARAGQRLRTLFQRIRQPSKWWMIPFAVSLSTIMTSIVAPLVQLVLQLVCSELLGDYGASDAQALAPGRPIDDRCNVPEVQALASRYLMWMQILTNVTATLSVGYLATLSDYKGRRFVFLLSSCGVVVAVLNILLVAHHWRTFGVKFLLIGAVVQGLFGGVIAIDTACHAYVSDCTTPLVRSEAFGLMHAAAYVGMTIGPTVGGLIIQITGSLLSVFYVALSAYVVFILFVLFVLPESLQFHLRSEPHASSSPYTIRKVFAALTILSQKPIESQSGEQTRSWSARNILYLLAVIYFIYRVTQAAVGDIFVLYATYKFHWTTLENGFFLSLQSFTRFMALVVLLPLFRLLQMAYTSINERRLDVWRMRGGIGMETIGFVMFAMATMPSMFYFAAVINSLATIATPAIRAIFTMLVPPTQSGQILGSLSVLDTVGSVLSPLWMNSLYSWGVVKGMPEITFWAIAGLYSVGSLLTFLVQ